MGVDASLFPPGYKFRGPSRRTPPKSWRLKLKDITPALTGAVLSCHGVWESACLGLECQLLLLSCGRSLKGFPAWAGPV